MNGKSIILAAIGRGYNTALILLYMNFSNVAEKTFHFGERRNSFTDATTAAPHALEFTICKSITIRVNSWFNRPLQIIHR